MAHVCISQNPPTFQLRNATREKEYCYSLWRNMYWVTEMRHVVIKEIEFIRIQTKRRTDEGDSLQLETYIHKKIAVS